MIREFFQRRAIRRAFSRYLSPGTVDALMSGNLKNPDILRLHAGQIDYVLVWLRAGSPEQISERMGMAAKLAEEFGGSTDCMVSGLLMISFGTLPLQGTPRKDRTGLVRTLTREFGDNVKLIHGSSSGHFGNLGGPTRMSYSFVLPEFAPALARLCALQFGQAEEFLPEKENG